MGATATMRWSRSATILLVATLLLSAARSALAAPIAVVAPSSGRRKRRCRRTAATEVAVVRIVRGGGGGPRRSVAEVAEASVASRPQSLSSATVEGLKNALASGLAAACSKTILQPFDTVKTVQQQTRSQASGKGLGFAEAVRMICAREGGVWNLYSGLAVSALGSMPSVGLYFGVYSYSKKKLIPLLRDKMGSSKKTGKPLLSDRTLRSMAIVCSAAVGNTVASFSRVPYEVVKQNLQTGKFTSTFGAMRSMYSVSGFRAFFPLGGVGAQMARDIPYAIFTLLAYEAMRDHWVKDRPGPLRDMVAGAISGGWGSYVTNPLDVLKTRLQTDGPRGELYGGSITKCAVATFEEGGPMAFLRGSVPRLMHKIPANGCFFVFYEFFRRMLRVEGAVKVSNTAAEKAAPGAPVVDKRKRQISRIERRN